MTKILIASAAYGMENIGDDGILASIVEQIKSKKRDIEITATTKEAKHMSKWLDIKTLELLGYYNRLLTYKAVFQTDVLIIGGGALILEHTRRIKSLITGHPGFPLTMVILARILKKPVMVYGAGVERVESNLKRFVIKHVYNMARVITVRDEESKNLLKSYYGVEKAPVFTTADPALSLTVPEEHEINVFLKEKKVVKDERPLIGINFAYGIDKRDELISFFAQTADYLISTMNAQILFIPMNILNKNDRCGMEKVVKQMEYHQNAKILTPTYTHKEIIGLVSKMDLVISSRMHLLIFATLSNTPIIAISRVPKIDAFLDFFGMRSGINTQNLDFEKFKVVIDETWQNRNNIKERLKERRDVMCRRAYSNVEYLKEFILEKRLNFF